MEKRSVGFNNEVIVTLYEKHYYLGVAALINSLCTSSFEGLISIGYRGELPRWISQLQGPYDGYYHVEKLTIEFIEIKQQLHLGYYKPMFLLESIERYPEVSKFYYFDPDIVVNAPWFFISQWVDCGIALCLDHCFPFVHQNHPWRRDWQRFFQGEVIELHKSNYYVNSGFIGIQRRDRIFLERWIDITWKYKEIGGDLTKFEKSAHRAVKGDQDLLNAAIIISPDFQYSIIGTEGMGFTQPAYLMSHAISVEKPWRKNFLMSLFLTGQKPGSAEKDYFRHCRKPISIFNNLTFYLKIINLKLAATIGRIFGS